MMSTFRFLIGGATVTATVLLFAGFFGSWHAWLDSLSHFRHFLIIAVFVGGVTSAAVGLVRLTASSLVAILAALVLSFPHLPFAAPSAETAGGFRIIQFNVKFHNAQQDEAVDWIIAQKPDVVTLQEFDPVNHPGFLKLAKDLPFEVRCKSRGLGYVAIRSRHQLLGQHCSDGESFAWAQIAVQGRRVTIASLHLAWPWPFKQAEQLENLREAFVAMPKPVVLAGDFNATPWSAAVGQVEDLTGTKVVGGFRTSLWLDVFHTGKPWPALPIDHVLLPEDAKLKSIGTGPFLGSDHLPVIAEFALN